MEKQEIIFLKIKKKVYTIEIYWFDLMFRNWSIKTIIIVFLTLLLCVAVFQVYMFLTNRSMIIHFGLSFLALFIALLFFHSVNIRFRRQKKR
ncbi:hypothetical protein AYK21_06330 [Thermoplasmatales archaeon SG8-52-2]|nr:MAG: hypothetical protein AYK21_06330 [Thermoplasmatales archaeon SG8-52-2]